jgi:hypothetical protein
VSRQLILGIQVTLDLLVIYPALICDHSILHEVAAQVQQPLLLRLLYYIESLGNPRLDYMVRLNNVGGRRIG